MATNNKKFVIKNGLAVGGASGIIDIIDSNGTWVGATGTLHGATGPAGSNGATGVGINGASGPSGATGIIQNWIVKTTTYTAVNKDAIAADTSGGSFTITLPASPSAGDSITIADSGHTFSANNLTVARNGSTIESSATDLTVDISNVFLSLIYDGSTWKLFTTVGVQGASGASGSNGTNGATGLTGATGAGVQGASGSAGTNGASGVQGLTGATGAGVQGASGFVGSNGATGPTGTSGATGIIQNWIVKTTTYTAVSKDAIAADTSGGAFTITLPATPASGDSITIADSGHSFNTNNLTIARNGSTIETQSQDLVVDIANVIVSFIYNGTTWKVFSTVGIQGASGAVGSQGTQGASGVTGATGSAGTNGATGASVQGASGATGIQGPAGQSSSYYNYKANTTSQSGDPGNGYISWDNATILSANTLQVSHLTNDSFDIDIFLAIISIGDTLIIQEANDSSRFQKWQVTGTPVAYTHQHYEYPVTLLDSGGTSITNNDNLILAVVSTPVDGATGPAGTNGATGVQGASGAAGTNGAAGATGSAGSNGTNGATGIQGASGVDGASGFVGSNGATGAAGATGSAGSNGTNGATGLTGATGAGTAGATGAVQNWIVKTTTYTAANKDAIAADTSGGAFTVTLPASPSAGHFVTFADSGHSFGTNNLTVGRNGSTIEASATDLILDVSNVFVSLIYDGTTWKAFSTVGVVGASGATGSAGATGPSLASANGDIMPAISGVSNIGSANNKFNALYTKSLYLDANTLYVEGVPVLSSSANNISFTADPNQGLRFTTTGTGNVVLTSNAGTTIQTTGQNGDVLVQSSGQGGLTRLTSATQVTLTAPTVAVVGNQTVSANLTVSGNFTVAGNVTSVDSTITNIKDNIITLNKGEIGSGVTLNVSGIEVDRGDLANQRLIWNEASGKWLAGPTSSEVALATETFVNTGLSGKANTDLSNVGALANNVIAQLKGDTGVTGATGVQGASGSAGTNGATGAAGTNGATGVAGSNGTDGATGSAGTNGATGVAGATGTGLTGATGPAGTGGGGGSSANVTNLTSVNTDYYASFIGSTGPLTDVYLANTDVKYNPSTTLFSTPFVNATGTITGLNAYGAISYGTLSYSDVNLMASFASSVNTYNQVLLQNKSDGTSASANFVVSNDLATNSTYYAEIGINSSQFDGGTDCHFHHSNTAYLASQTVDLAIGTYGTNNVHFIVNNSIVDSMTINANNSIQVNAPFKVTTGATGFTGATGAIGAPSAYFDNVTSGNITTSTITTSGSGGNITGANNITASGDITANNFIGNGSQLTGIGSVNRIINGSMAIDQRNAGASVTPASTSYVSCDRWYPQMTQASKYSVQQQTAVVPPGFYYAQRFSVVSTVSTAAGDYFGTEQRLEGYNVNDFNYGTANAKDTTLSFWVYANNAGTYCGSIYNPTGSTRSFVFNYTLAANTWTKITVNIPGDTTTVLGSSTNGQALSVRFTLSVGSNFQTVTTNSWITGNYGATSSAFNWIGTSGATLYITGVQLEVGSTASSFEFRHYQQELALNQRYYFRMASPNNAYCWIGMGRSINASYGDAAVVLPVPMRTGPTLSYSALTDFQCNFAGTLNSLSISPQYSNNSTQVLLSVGPGNATAGLVQILQFNAANTATSFIAFSAEL